MITKRYRHILYAFIFIVFSPISNAARDAVVSSDTALIYADVEMTSIIGHLNYGTTVKVGEVKRNYNQVLPIAVSGRIAWIRVADLNFEEDRDFSRFHKNREQRMGTLRPVFERKEVEEDRYLFASYGSHFTNYQWREFSEFISTNELTTVEADHFRLLIEHRMKEEPYHWGYGLNYYKFEAQSETSESLRYQGLFAEILISRILRKRSLYTIDLSLGVLAAPQTEVKASTSEVDYRERAPAWGVKTGIALKIFPHSKLSFHSGINYESLRPMGLRSVGVLDTGIEPQSLSHLSSVSFLVGLAYRL